MIDVERPSEYERLDSEESEIPHEFRHLRNLRSPFACRAPSEGWEAMDGDDVTRSPVEYTLIFPVDLKQSQVLLGLKRRGMGYNLYNGFGGKVEKGETVWEGAIRELQEETGLIANDDDFYYKGCLYSSRPLSPPPSTETCIIKIHFFACVAWRGQAVTTEEMIPEWFPLPSLDSPELHRIPVDQMWPEASFYLLPILDSILHNKRSDIFLSRINYRFIRELDVPNNLPAIEGNTIRKSRPSQHNDDLAERLCSWWMSLSPMSLSPFADSRML